MINKLPLEKSKGPWKKGKKQKSNINKLYDLVEEGKKFNSYQDWIDSYSTDKIDGLSVLWNKIGDTTLEKYPNVRDFWETFIKPYKK